MSVVVFLVILMVLIVVHELGHFFAAKLSRVKVIELGLGFPPRIFGIKRGDTVYSLNAVPLGGFCKMAGEEDPGVPYSLASKARWVRTFVLSAGSIAMLLFPLFLLPLSYAVPVERYVEGPGVQVVAIASGSPAEEAGIQPRDIILAVDGEKVNSLTEMHQALESKAGTEVTLQILRRPDTGLEITLVPRLDPPEGEGAIGIQMGPLTDVVSYPMWQAAILGFTEYGQMWVAMANVVGQLVNGVEMPPGWEGPPVAGPIGMAQLTAEVAAGGAYVLIVLTCYLSINLAIVNLLPIPALDGGRIAFVFLEVLRGGRRISPNTEGLINTIGFGVLMALILVVSYFDVLRLIHGGSMLP